MIYTYLVLLLAPPRTGLYFLLSNIIYLPGDSVFISDIGPQPADNRNDPGSTLVCVTTNVNTACCRSSDNPDGLVSGGPAGEWYYPNNDLVSRLYQNSASFTRIRHMHQVRLAKQTAGILYPRGVYMCSVPLLTSGQIVNASITIEMQGN